MGCPQPRPSRAFGSPPRPSLHFLSAFLAYAFLILRPSPTTLPRYLPIFPTILPEKPCCVSQSTSYRFRLLPFFLFMTGKSPVRFYLRPHPSRGHYTSARYRPCLLATLDEALLAIWDT